MYLHSGDSSEKQDKQDKNFQGFGRFMTSNNGEYYFRTIKPVPYPGRTPHIHFKVKKGGKELLTTQCYIKGEPLNMRDGIDQSVSKEPAVRSMFKFAALTCICSSAANTSSSGPS